MEGQFNEKKFIVLHKLQNSKTLLLTKNKGNRPRGRIRRQSTYKKIYLEKLI